MRRYFVYESDVDRRCGCPIVSFTSLEDAKEFVRGYLYGNLVIVEVIEIGVKSLTEVK